jgi:hypothetical protein
MTPRTAWILAIVGLAAIIGWASYNVYERLKVNDCRYLRTVCRELSR